MRRFSILLPATLLLLSACAAKSDVPADEVLKRSSQANQTLDSAAFDFDLLLRIPSAAGITTVDAVASGVMQNGGRQLQFELETEGTSAAGTPWRALGQFVVAGEGETYVKLDELEVGVTEASDQIAQNFDAFTGSWWLLPAAQASGTADVTPDPRLLQMQTDVIDVTRDRGIVSLDGHRVHHYDVAVNNEKLAAFLSSVRTGSGAAVDTSAIEAQLQGIDLTGEIWIDADSYVLRSARWHADNPIPGSDPLLEMRMRIHDQNEDFTVSPPADFQPLALPLPGLPAPTF